MVALRAAQVDRLRGALAPALEALRSRDAWLSAARDRLLAIEGELAFGLAAADLGETDAAERALRAACDEAHARGLGPLEAQVLLALGTLHRERALAGTTGRRGGRGPAPSPASLGSARAAFKQAHERAKALGYGPAEAEAELAVARLDLLDGDEDACRVRVGRVRDGLGAEQRALQAECAALEVELLAGRDPEQAIVRADEVDAQTPALRLRLALLREAASRDAGSRLEAQAALAEANAALDDLRAGLDSADRAQLERTWLAVAVADARRTRAAEAGRRPRRAPWRARGRSTSCARCARSTGRRRPPPSGGPRSTGRWPCSARAAGCWWR